MSSLSDFLQKISNINRGVRNITRTVSTVNATVRSIKTLRDQFSKKKKPTPSTQSQGPVTQPTASTRAPLRKPLGLTPVSRVTTGRNENKRPVRPPSRRVTPRSGPPTGE